jgi:hypothetical protein
MHASLVTFGLVKADLAYSGSGGIISSAFAMATGRVPTASRSVALPHLSPPSR